MARNRRRFVAVLLAVCILFQTYIYAPAVGAEESSTASGDGYFVLNGVNVEYETTLSDSGNGIYTLGITLSSSHTRAEVSRSKTSAENGTYTAAKDGWYLVELWGGNGASVEGAGVGGNAGHVYAKIRLTEGQTLYYSLGGDGSPSQKSNVGGGANGDGGDHGLVGSYTVGGGGGYSAVFLYDNGEFEEKYGSLDAKSITEEDRTSKYIMIAGGGGGGGAAPNSGTVVGTADGGNGGNIEGGASGNVSGTGVVAGTYYAGADGKSSGTSSSYVGKGGTNVPGAVSDSMWGITDAKATPPDNWFGTVGGTGGAGGSGELRGGAGGAGFAGGSGGLMTSVLISSNVGGGGGGSSFVAASMSALGETDTQYLKSSRPSEQGGAVCVTYLDNASHDFLNSLSLEGCLSPYVIPHSAGISVTYSDSKKTFDYENNLKRELHGGEANHEKITISNLSLLDSNNNVDESVHITLSFTYSDGFMGGNNVPILRSATSAYDCPLTLSTTMDGVERSMIIELGRECGHVNMPLRVEAHAHHLETNVAGTAFTVDKLYYDHYTDVRDNLANYSYEYDYIAEIGKYIIREHGTTVFDGSVENSDPTQISVTPNTTTTYNVILPVRLKTPVEYATVGERTVPDANGYVYIQEEASITVPDSRSERIGKFMATYTKGVSYSDGFYDYSINVKASTTQEHNITTETEGVNHVVNFDTTKTNEYEHVIEVTGWYLIQVWGGNGGAGGNSLVGSGSGGAGGSGGYVSGYVHLDRGDTVNIFMGVNGTDNSSKWMTLGGAGKHSRVSVFETDENGNTTETVLMIAGGGGGGGYYSFGTGNDGGSVASSYSTDGLNAENEYAAYDGKTGNGRTGGAAGTNYINTALVRTSVLAEDNLDSDALGKLDGASSDNYEGNGSVDGTEYHGGGTAFVKCLQITNNGVQEVLRDIKYALTDFGLETVVSKYFRIESVSISNLHADFEAPIIAYNYVYGSDTALTVDDIVPIVNTSTSDDGKVHSANTDFTILIRLSPSEGFVGGNAVPLFVDGEINLTHTQVSAVEESVAALSQSVPAYESVGMMLLSATSESSESESEEPTDISVTTDTEEPTDISVTTDTEEPADTSATTDTEETDGTTLATDTEEPTDISVTTDTEEPADTSATTDTEETDAATSAADTEEPTDISVTTDIEEPADTSSDIAAISTELKSITEILENRLAELNEGDTQYQAETVTALFGANDITDYVNVSMEGYTSPELEGNTVFYTSPLQELTTDDLYTVLSGSIPTLPAENAWLYDYVEIVNSIKKYNGSDVGEFPPSVSTVYNITMGLEPKYESKVEYNAESERNPVCEPQEARLTTVMGVVIVGHEVEFVLTDLTVEGVNVYEGNIAFAHKDLDFTFTLVPADGKVLPNDIEIVLGASVLAEGDSTYTYDRISGEVSVKSSAITDELVITAEAHNKKYNVNFVYAETPDATEHKTVTQRREAQTSLSGAFHETYVPPVFEGYDFAWDWGNGSTTPPDTMPEYDLWVTGTYTRQSYTLTVDFVYENGDRAADSVEQTLLYGESYAVSVPTVNGYLPKVNGELTTTVNGTMNAGNVNVTVTYFATENTLTVVYRNSVTGEQVYDTETYTFDTGETYNIEIKSLSGYTQSSDGVTANAEWTAVEGIMPADGVTVTVYYIPNTYTVTFDDGTAQTSRSVVYDDIYGNGDNGVFSTFDKPVKEHYIFEGWYLGDTLISEDSVVKTASDHTLTAKWTAYKYTLTIKYVYEGGNTAHDDYSDGYAYNAEYSVDSPDISGYTPDADPVTGNMPSQDIVLTVTYSPQYSAVISADITWGDLSFNYVPWTWDPETLSYIAGGAVEPNTPDGNTITVTNSGSYAQEGNESREISVHASFSYSPNTENAEYAAEYALIKGYFTQNGSSDAERIERAEIAHGEQRTVYFWLEGDIRLETKAAHKVGSCTVTINQGG